MSDYRSGYGQGKADAISRIDEMLAEVEDTLFDNSEVRPVRDDPGYPAPVGRHRSKLLIQRETLRWLKSVLKSTLKCPQ